MQYYGIQINHYVILFLNYFIISGGCTYGALDSKTLE